MVVGTIPAPLTPDLRGRHRWRASRSDRAASGERATATQRARSTPRHFDRKADAQRWLDQVTSEQLLAAGAGPDRRGELTWFDIGTYVYSLPEDEQAQVVESLGPALGLDPEVLDRFEPGDFTQAATMLDIVDDPSERVGSFPPLYLATVRGDADMVSLLMAAGADPDIGTEPTGHLPRQAAESLGRAGLVALLQPE